MLSKQNNQVDKASIKSFRNDIMALEEAIKQVDGAMIGNAFPLKHTFADGIYVREITIPAGIIMTGKIHKHDHPNFLLKGSVTVITEEGGEQLLVAPCSMISPKHTKRALYTHTECVWTTIHLNPSNITDIDKLEKQIVVETYEELEWTHVKRLGKNLKTKLLRLGKSALRILGKQGTPK